MTNKIFKEIYKIKLEGSEKARIKMGIVNFMVRNQAPNRYQSHRSNILTLFKFNQIKNMPILLALAILLSVGTSVAAQSSLPGDPLYPVKINFNEEVRSWFAISKKAKANFNTELAAARLEEASQLAAENKLDAKTAAEVKANFKARTDAANRFIIELKTDGDTQAAAEALADLGSALEAHAQVLAQLSASGATKAEIKQKVEEIRTEIRKEINANNSVNADVKIKISADNSADMQTAVENKIASVENKIEGVSAFIEAKEENVEASVIANANAKLDAASALIIQAEADIAAKDYGKAFVKAQEAMKMAQEAKLIVATNNKIELKLRTEMNKGDENRASASFDAKTRTNIKLDLGL